MAWALEIDEMFPSGDPPCYGCIHNDDCDQRKLLEEALNNFDEGNSIRIARGSVMITDCNNCQKEG